jgi:glucose/arabinose dehydrogenase
MNWRKHALLIGGLSVAALGGTAWYLFTDDVARVNIADMYGHAPKLTEVRPEGFPTINIAKIVGWQGDAKPVAAAGLSTGLFADALDHPRWMRVLSNGDVLVAESTQPERPTDGVMDWVARKLVMDANGSSKSANRITLLRDTNKDGKADFRSVLLTAKEGLNSPFGMEVLGDTLYVANTDALLAFPFKLGDTKITAKGAVIVKLPAGSPNNHWARNVIAAKDGKSLFVTVGSNSNIGENGMEREKDRANILQVDPVKKTFGIFAYGLRNPNGLAFEPQSGYLWTTVNERDMLGSDGPPDYLTTVDLGTFYGWPWYFWGGYEDQRVKQTRPDLQQYSKRPNYALGPHTASLGLAFAGGASLGPKFTRGAFVAQHGSWNRSPASGYKVVYIPFNERGFPDHSAKPVDVLTGFLNAKGDAQGRPTGVVVAGDGSLLVTDDSGNRIWRVSASTAVASIASK